MTKFAFGKNWKAYLNVLLKKENYNNGIGLAKKDIITFANLKNLKNKTFIDIGCGSGLSSLVARKIGAEVFSLDVDQNSIDCTKFLKSKFFKNDSKWKIKKLSILNSKNIKNIKKHDYVYSWGVLHHTGNLNLALKNTELLCKKNGVIHLALYNDQGRKSKRWLFIKKLYVNNNIIIKKILEIFFYPFFVLKPYLKILFLGQSNLRKRGMGHYIDMIDWIGGYPFEPTKPEKIIKFFLDKKYDLINLKTCGAGHGNNEYLFKKK